MAIGKNIKLFRINADMKQKELAEKLGIKVSYLSSVENDRKEPSLSSVKKNITGFRYPCRYVFPGRYGG